MTDPTGGTDRITMFGVAIDPLTMADTLQRVEACIQQRRTTQHVVVNVAKLVLMQTDPRLRDIVNSCGLINADGQGIVWGARLLGLPVPERVAGIDLFTRLVERSAERGYRLYFLGAQQEIVDKVVARFQREYPTLQVAGARNGYFSESEEDGIVRTIRDARADVLFVAMGSPQKEYFLHKHLQAMQVPFVMGVGGSFDVVAGLVKRAPLWMQRCGLEWFYRLVSEPGRLWKRYLYTNVVFLGMLLKAMARGKFRRTGPPNA